MSGGAPRSGPGLLPKRHGPLYEVLTAKLRVQGGEVEKKLPKIFGCS